MQNKQELEIFRRISDDLNVVFDVGTRDDIDYYLIKNDCEYHLFEPNIKFSKIIKNKIDHIYNPNKKVFINQIGLSNENVKDAMYYENTESFVEHWQGLSLDRGHKFDLTTIDDYVEKNNISKIDFLKTDCEELDFKVLVGGLKTIKYNNSVKFLQIEYSYISPIIELFNNFDFYLMMESGLYDAISKITNNQYNNYFNKSLIKMDKNLINFLDRVVSPSGIGGNLFGINKNENYDVNKLIFNI